MRAVDAITIMAGVAIPALLCGLIGVVLYGLHAIAEAIRSLGDE